MVGSENAHSPVIYLYDCISSSRTLEIRIRTDYGYVSLRKGKGWRMWIKRLHRQRYRSWKMLGLFKLIRRVLVRQKVMRLGESEPR